MINVSLAVQTFKLANEDWITPLCDAIEIGNNEILQSLLQYIKKNHINKKDIFGNIALDKAIEKGNLKAISLLLEYGARSTHLNIFTFFSISRYNSNTIDRQLIYLEFYDLLYNFQKQNLVQAKAKSLKQIIRKIFAKNDLVSTQTQMPLHEKLLIYKILIVETFDGLNIRELNYLYSDKIIYPPLKEIAAKYNKEIYYDLYIRSKNIYEHFLAPQITRLTVKIIEVMNLPNDISKIIINLAANGQNDIEKISIRSIQQSSPPESKFLNQYNKALELPEVEEQIKTLFKAVTKYALNPSNKKADHHIKYFLDDSIIRIKDHHSITTNSKFTSKFVLDNIKHIEEQLNSGNILSKIRK